MIWDDFNTIVLKWRAGPGSLCFRCWVASASSRGLCFYFSRGPELPYGVPVLPPSYLHPTRASLPFFLTLKTECLADNFFFLFFPPAVTFSSINTSFSITCEEPSTVLAASKIQYVWFPVLGLYSSASNRQIETNK